MFTGTLRITELPPPLQGRAVEEDRGYGTPCWVWQGRWLTYNGYGRVRYQGRTWRVHRLARVLMGFPCPEDLTMDHLCRVRLCLRPDHMEPTSIGENVLRGEGSAAQRARQTECVHGHPLSGGNLWVQPKTGYRKCRRCNADRARERHRRVHKVPPEHYRRTRVHRDA